MARVAFSNPTLTAGSSFLGPAEYMLMKMIVETDFSSRAYSNLKQICANSIDPETKFGPPEFCTGCRREFEHRFAGVRIPSKSTIHDLVNKVRRTGTFLNKKRIQQRRVLTE
ncbi:hypothetical protein ANN_04017 [Periplaneta americana]|uniref:Uncharacterized protein n=1 Tax=Periplaneta americana TaxID=6978 RepID=A0ABQ8T8L7_PERAM|nr:hypothetical protein ANN_04017 [Periplaneta americana]